MPTKLTDIHITHISLVKEGANGKTFIYKSAPHEGGYKMNIDIKKSDEEQGVVYGIVYAPGEVDSQGDFAEATDIKKAAYAFMKSLNVKNVDVHHSFQNEEAFVAESWVIKAGDPVFPEEPEGAWAVAIQLESDELRKLAKSGELKGLSMAGRAKKEEVKKSDAQSVQIQRLFSSLADAVGEVWFDFSGILKKNKEEGDDMAHEMAGLAEQIKKKVNEATTGVAAEIDKATAEQNDKIAALEKSAAEAKDAVDSLKKENETLAETNTKLTETLQAQDGKIADLEKRTEEAEEALKKSAQKKTIIHTENNNNEKQGVM